MCIRDSDTSEEYKQNILFIRDRQKSMIKSGTAVCGGENIMWNNSLSQGQAMVKKEKKLILRAFNGECDKMCIRDSSYTNPATTGNIQSGAQTCQSHSISCSNYLLKTNPVSLYLLK